MEFMPPGTGGTSGSPATSREWVKLAVLCGFLVVVLGALVGSAFFASRRRAESGPAGGVPAASPVAPLLPAAPTDSALPEVPAPLPPKPTQPFVDDPIFLRGVRDATPIEETALMHLLHEVSSLSSAEIGARVEPEIHCAQLMKDPAQYRGRFVAIRGRLLNFYRELAPVRPNPAGVEVLYRGLLIDKWNNVCNFAVIENDREWATGLYGDGVEVAGVFLKVHRFKNLKDNNVDLPLVIGRRLVPLAVGESGESGLRQFEWYMAIVVLGGLLVLGIALRRTRKADEAFESDWHRRHAKRPPSKRIAKPGTEAPPGESKSNEIPPGGSKPDVPPSPGA